MNFIFPYIGNVIIPTDFHIFPEGWNHQPANLWVLGGYFPSRTCSWSSQCLADQRVLIVDMRHGSYTSLAISFGIHGRAFCHSLSIILKCDPSPLKEAMNPQFCRRFLMCSTVVSVSQSILVSMVWIVAYIYDQLCLVLYSLGYSCIYTNQLYINI